MKVPSGVHVVVRDVDGGVSGEVARVRDRPVGRVAEPVDADSTKVGEAARAEVKLRDSKRTRLHLYTQNTHNVNLIAVRLSLPELNKTYLALPRRVVVTAASDGRRQTLVDVAPDRWG